jgi:glycerol-3-phosphate acyltransferase PlsY
LTEVPCTAPSGSGTGTAQLFSGTVDASDMSDSTIGSPAAIATAAVAPSRCGCVSEPTGIWRHSTSSGTIACPRLSSAAAKGNGSVDRSETSHTNAAATSAAAANHLRYGGRPSQSTLPPYLVGLAKRRPLIAETLGARLYNCDVSPLISGSFALAASYLIGSFSFAIQIAVSQGVDIRQEGSGNAGASNVMRVLGRRTALLVLIGDGLKGAAAAWLGTAIIGPEFGYATLLAAIVGHTFPLWHGFKGGRSVATAVGGFAFLAPGVGLFLGVVWFVVVAVWKTASIASITVMILVVPAMWMAGRSNVELLWTGVIAIFVLVRHSSNIKRLLSSSERKVTG